MSDKMSQAVVSVCGYDVTSLYDEIDDSVWSSLPNWCGHLGIRAENQIEKLREDPIYQGFLMKRPITVHEKTRHGTTRDRTQDVWCIHNKRLVMWFCSIQSRRIKPEHRSTLISLQAESADVLYAYWHGETITRKPSAAVDEFGVFQALDALRLGLHGLYEKVDHVEAKLDNYKCETDRKLTRLEQTFYEDKKQRRKTAQRIAREESNAAFRYKLLEASNKTCMRCDRELIYSTLEIDEVFPVRYGGNRAWNNVQALCEACNKWRTSSNWWESDYRQKYPGFLAYCQEQWSRKNRGGVFKLQGYPVNQLPLQSLGTDEREF